MASSGLTPVGVLLRFAFAAVLILASYNPEGFSYYDWALKDFSSFDPLKGIVGVLLLVGWTVYLRATLLSLGGFGLFLALAFFGMVVWAFVYYGVIAADSSRAITYLAMFVLAGILTAGMSWSLLRRQISGQVDVDEVDLA